ncbi:MAG: DUF6446 family protein [Pseudomonadota bacterium]
MSGRLLMSGLLVFCVLFGAALWYFQIYAFYEEVEGVTEIEMAGDAIAVTEYQGIEATSSPLKLRACFQTSSAALPTETAPNATPLTAPYWFECFDAEQIARDLEDGNAMAILAAREESDGVDRYVALYPDGSGFMWRQLNEKFADQ